MVLIIMLCTDGLSSDAFSPHAQSANAYYFVKIRNLKASLFTAFSPRITRYDNKTMNVHVLRLVWFILFYFILFIYFTSSNSFLGEIALTYNDKSRDIEKALSISLDKS